MPVALAAFTVALDGTVVNVALPSVGRDLHLGPAGLEWVASSYLLAFATLLLAGGSLVDRFGRRATLLAGLLVFGAGAATAATAPDAGLLVAARAAQGTGAALVLPATLALVATDLPAHARALGAGTWTAANAVALALGPVVGGAVAEHASWRLLFAVHVPVVVVAVGLVLRLPAGGRTARSPVDVPGLVLSAAGVGLLGWAAQQAQASGGHDPAVRATLAAGLVVVVLLILVERRAATPVLDLRLLAGRAFAGGTVAQVLWGLGMSGIFFFTALLLQDVLGLSPAAAGACFLPLAAALLVTVPLSGPLAARIGVDRAVAGGLVLVGTGLLAAATVAPGDGPAALLPALLLLGAGSGLTTPVVSHLLEGVPVGRRGCAAGLLSTARELAAALGIPVVGAVVLGREGQLLRAGKAQDVAFVSGYAHGACLAAALVLTGALLAAVTLGPGATKPELGTAAGQR